METDPQDIRFGLDIGGTSLRVAGVDRTGLILAKERWARDPSTDRSGFLDALVAGTLRVSARLGVDCPAGAAVGVAVPGTLDAERRGIVRSVNLPFLEGYELAEALAVRLGRRTRLFTDAEAAAWGEYLACPTPPDRFVHLRLGTGVGCGVVLDGKLQRIDLGRTNHLEELVVDSKVNMPCCPCGRRGCLETMASGAALADRAAACGFSGGLTGLQEAAASGDDAATALLDDVAEAVAIVIDRLTDRFSPKVLVLGGGVIDHLPDLFERILQRYRTRLEQSDPLKPQLQRARRGDDAGVVGAAMLAAMVSIPCERETRRRADAIGHVVEENFEL